MKTWNVQDLQEEFEKYACRKQNDADHCAVKIRAGEVSYEKFYDGEMAEMTIAFVLSTDAALSSRQCMLDRLESLRVQVTQGDMDAYGIYSQKNISSFRHKIH